MSRRGSFSSEIRSVPQFSTIEMLFRTPEVTKKEFTIFGPLKILKLYVRKMSFLKFMMELEMKILAITTGSLTTVIFIFESSQHKASSD